MRTLTPLRVIAAAGALVLSLSACGTRASNDEVLRGVGAGGGTITLDPNQVAALRGGSSASNGGSTGTAGDAPGSVQHPSSGAATGTGSGGSAGAVAAPRTTTPTTTTGGSSGGATTGGAGTKAGCARRGAPIVLGQVGSFSGALGPLNAGAKTGLQVWAKAINAQGGVACHPVSVVADDDGADPSKAQSAVQDLVQNKHAVAILGSFVQLSFAGFRSGIESQHVPAVGGDVLDPNWNASPMAFPQGANISAQIIGAFKQLADQGHKKIALLYCVESSICSNTKKVAVDQGGATKAGSAIVYSAQVSITQSDFTAQCQNAKNAGADVLAAAVDGSSIIRIARSCSALNYHPAFATGAGAIGAAQAEDPGLEANTLSIASTVAPWSNNDNAAENAFQAAMKTYASGTTTDGPSSIAWASGQLFAAAVDKLGAEAVNGPLTSAMVLKGLGMVKNETLGGLIPPVSFAPGQRGATEGRCVYYVLLTKNGWHGPLKSKPVCV